MDISTQITTSIDIAASTNSGVPILTSTPHHPSSAAIRNLAAMFTGDPVSPSGAEPGRHADVDGERRSRFRIRR
jgi:pilus assembly protein CpaE